MAALASWLDAKAHGGQWLVRIEDVDTPRCVPGADKTILQQLAACGLHPDEPPSYQSQRSHLYQEALEQLINKGLAYPCACTRQDISKALAESGQPKARNGELVYPGTCRSGLHGRVGRAWRLSSIKNESNWHLAQAQRSHTAIEKIASKDINITWHDRQLGQQQQNISREVGDFVLKRADGYWAYQLAVVVDDAAQGITHIVRGQDLADNTARQIFLQQALGLPQPIYMHTPLVLGSNGEKLSKQNGAQALDLADPLAALRKAAHTLQLAVEAKTPADWLKKAVQSWGEQHLFGHTQHGNSDSPKAI